MKIKLTTIYVEDQDMALRFYTQAAGFVKKTDISQGPYRWLTVASPEEPDGTELQLALNDNAAGKAYQQALFQQGQPAAMFFSDDVQHDYERMKVAGAEFTMPVGRENSIITESWDRVAATMLTSPRPALLRSSICPEGIG